MDFKEIIISIF